MTALFAPQERRAWVYGSPGELLVAPAVCTWFGNDVPAPPVMRITPGVPEAAGRSVLEALQKFRRAGRAEARRLQTQFLADAGITSVEELRRTHVACMVRWRQTAVTFIPVLPLHGRRRPRPLDGIAVAAPIDQPATIGSALEDALKACAEAAASFTSAR